MRDRKYYIAVDDYEKRVSVTLYKAIIIYPALLTQTKKSSISVYGVSECRWHSKLRTDRVGRRESDI